MKKIFVCFLTFCLLFVGVVIPTFAEDTERVAPSAYDIPAEVIAQISELHPDYEKIVRVYDVGMYFHTLAEDENIHHLLSKESVSLYYYVFLPNSAAEQMILGYREQNGELQNVGNSNDVKQTMYAWLSDVVNATSLTVQGVEEPLAIDAVYFLRTFSPPRCWTIVYDVGDISYYAVYVNGVDQAPVYLDEASFYRYVHEWLAAWKAMNEGGEEGPSVIGGSVSVDLTSYPTISIALGNMPVETGNDDSPSWHLPVLIGGGAVILIGGGVGVGIAVTKSRKKKTVA